MHGFRRRADRGRQHLQGSIAGKGEANAQLNPFAPSPAPLKFKVVPVVGKNQLLFVLSGPANAVLHGKISGKKMTISITTELQQPAPNAYSALLDLSTELSKKKGSKALITSTGCTSKKHKIGVSIGFVGTRTRRPPAPRRAPPTRSARSPRAHLSSFTTAPRQRGRRAS